MPDLVEILVTAKNLTTPAFAEAKSGATAMESSMKKLGQAGTLAAAAVVGFVGESIKMASDFDSKMTLLTTQAGVSKDQIAGLKKGVLDLAGQVGFSPDSLAESLYHVESNAESMGITSAGALNLVKVAAEGAAVGHADLVDVTNALTAAVASGIPGVQDMSQAMGVLNATVGVGDMSMQDLAKAFGTGMLATVKGFGVTIADVSAGLATLGDNNIRGAAAGTQFRMAIQAMAAPVASATDELHKLGLTHQSLADDMQRGGMKLALEDLDERFRKLGMTTSQEGEAITQLFGKKAGQAISIFLEQMDRVESKYTAAAAGAQNFGQSWADTQKTFSQQTKELDASLQALMIQLGEKLIPYVQKATTYFLAHKEATVQVLEVTGAFIVALAGFGVITKIIDLFKTFGDAVKGVGEAFSAYKTRIFEVMLANTQAGESVTFLGASFEALGTSAKIAMAGTAIGLLVTGLVMLSDAIKPAPPNVDKLTTSLENLANKGEVAGELAKTFGTNIGDLGIAVDRVKGKIDQSIAMYDRFGKAFSQSSATGLTLGQAKDQINALDQSLANMVQGGHADLAAQAVKRLDDAMVQQGKDPGQLNKMLQKYGDSLDALKTQNDLTAASMGPLGQTAITVSQQLQQEDESAQGLKDAIIALNEVNRGAIGSMADLEGAVASAADAVAKNGASLHMTNGELDLTTASARENAKALIDLAKKTDDAAEAALKNNEGMDKANQIYDLGRTKLIENARQMGLNTEQAKELADQILSTPDRTAQLKADETDLQQKIAAAADQLNSLPPDKQIALKAEISQMESELSQIQGEIDNVHGKTVDIYINPKMGQSSLVSGMAHGGIVGYSTAAEGGPRNGMTLVGEQGPELVRLPFGSTVFPAGQSRSMMQSAAAAAPTRVQIEWVGGDAGDEFMAWLRKSIRIRGGDVQTVLGQ